MRSGPTKAMLESFNKDKAVQDNIVESWLCIDCHVNTAPGFLSGPETRVAFALGKSVPMHFDDTTEVYHVKDAIWKAAGMRPWSGCLCVGCLERRIGRELRPKDFARHDDRAWRDLPCSDRLLDRRGFRKITVIGDDGEEEIIIIDRADADRIAAAIPAGQLPHVRHT